jgi:hypothetical protein
MSGVELLETRCRRGDMHPGIVSGRTDAWTRKRAHAAGALAIIDRRYQVEVSRTRAGDLARGKRLWPLVSVWAACIALNEPALFAHAKIL